MHGDWLKVMLDEVARKRAEAGRALEEERRRVEEREAAGGARAARPAKPRRGAAKSRG